MSVGFILREAAAEEDAVNIRLNLTPVAALLVLSACSEPSSTQQVQSRATTSLSPTQACNSQSSVEYLPNGALVRIPDTSLFVIGRTEVSDCGRYVLSSVVEAMLDPRLMQVIVQPAGDTEAYLPRERAGTLVALLSHPGFVPRQPPVVVQPPLVPSAHIWGVALEVAHAN
jgi:hypothetical protein